MIDVTAIGELLIDFTCKSTDEDGYPTMVAHPGGAPANYLAALSNFGAKTAMIGKVGKDAFGNMLIGTLNKCGINTTGMVSSDDAFTTLAFVTLDATGDREFSFARKPGADTCLSFEDIDLKLIDSSRVLHFGTLSLTSHPSKDAVYRAVEYAMSQRKLISFDPNLRKPLWDDLEDAHQQMLWGLKMADVIKISDEEIDFLFGLSPEEGAHFIRENFGVSLVFATCGAEGAYYETANCHGFVKSLDGINVIDTTGAGDIFGGSAMFKLLQIGKDINDLLDSDLQEITCFACTVAGLSTTKAGGISSVPTCKEVMSWVYK